MIGPVSAPFSAPFTPTSIQDLTEYSSLEIACFNKNEQAAVQFILTNGFPENFRVEFQTLLLQWLSRSTHTDEKIDESIKELILRGANVSEKDENGKTAFENYLDAGKNLHVLLHTKFYSKDLKRVKEIRKKAIDQKFLPEQAELGYDEWLTSVDVASLAIGCTREHSVSKFDQPIKVLASVSNGKGRWNTSFLEGLGAKDFEEHDTFIRKYLFKVLTQALDVEKDYSGNYEWLSNADILQRVRFYNRIKKHVKSQTADPDLRKIYMEEITEKLFTAKS